jgi:hypothetical protein
MPNFFHLNFFEYPFKESFEFPNLNDQNYQRLHRVEHWYLWHFVGDENLKVVSDEIIEWANVNSLEIDNSHIFCGLPNRKGIVHSDGETGSYHFGINWAFGSDNSYLAWFNFRNNHPDPFAGDQNGPTLVRQWQDDDVVEIERSQSKGPTLVNASVPHRGVNNSNELRWAFSLRFKNGTFKNWEETVQFFQPYFKI